MNHVGGRFIREARTARKAHIGAHAAHAWPLLEEELVRSPKYGVIALIETQQGSEALAAYVPDLWCVTIASRAGEAVMLAMCSHVSPRVGQGVVMMMSGRRVSLARSLPISLPAPIQLTDHSPLTSSAAWRANRAAFHAAHHVRL
eukprot:CAMPEP_0181211952 /NCGR_PEP_ID=MMETSP1096-20121128/24076_1 /TAXON_ID=156174 ORGANISM="Chrysochromulina ericina, Strain CCMP281" /NCGR_SAMPLE_ID=MMETSP1096 /ASSEMBLY_ACC=CAM_ASM_000453 /LENGTH=144 /DNA_ID=CAMNT_0023303419 /DNA_START=683 /DNA_END=1118 /DNA_ORIENTATION=-